MSLPLPVSMNPKPLSVSRLMVPSAIYFTSQEIALKLSPKTPCSGFSTAKLELYQAEGLPRPSASAAAQRLPRSD